MFITFSFSSKSNLNIALYGDDEVAMAEALNICKGRRPLVIYGESGNIDEFIKMAKASNVPLTVTCANIEEAASATARAKQGGVEEIVINIKNEYTNRKIYRAYTERK